LNQFCHLSSWISPLTSWLVPFQESFPQDQDDISTEDESCESENDDQDVSDEEEESSNQENSDDDSDVTDEDHPSGPSKKFLLDVDDDLDQHPQFSKQARIDAILEAAAASKDKKGNPVLRNATAALDEAAQTITRMRSDASPRDKKWEAICLWPNSPTNSTFPPSSLLSRTLIAACTDNDVNAVRRLLVEGNSLNDATDDGDSLLSLACSAGYYELAQVLLAMSAQVEDRGQKNDCTPLMEAASAGHIEIIELLIRHGADVNAQSSTGNTPLMYACAGGHVEAVKALLNHGANVEDHNENGHTPLMEAASAGHVAVAKVSWRFTVSDTWGRLGRLKFVWFWASDYNPSVELLSLSCRWASSWFERRNLLWSYMMLSTWTSSHFLWILA
jgi:ankyrin repeat domain-containing protein 17